MPVLLRMSTAAERICPTSTLTARLRGDSFSARVAFSAAPSACRRGGGGLPAPDRVGRSASKDASVYDGQVDPGACCSVGFQVPESPAASRGEPDGFTSGGESFGEASHPVVEAAGSGERPIRSPGRYRLNRGGR